MNTQLNKNRMEKVKGGLEFPKVPPPPPPPDPRNLVIIKVQQIQPEQV